MSMRRLTWWFMAATLVASSVGAWHTTTVRQDVAGEDDPAGPVEWEDLSYPPIARRAGVQGVVIIEVRLDEHGAVTSASPLSGPSLLAVGALEAVKKWRFAPSRDRRAVMVFDFAIDDGVCHDTERGGFRLGQKNFASIATCAVSIGGQ